MDAENYSTAIIAFQDALGLRPKAVTYSAIGDAYYLLGQYDQAKASLLQALSAGAEDVQTYALMGATYAHLNRCDEAQTYVDRALAISPDESGDGDPLPVEVEGGWATVVVPRVENYTIVALYHGKALAASANVSNARRAHWRASLIGRETDTSFNDRLDRTLTLLRAGRLDAGEPAAAELLRRTQSEASRP